MSFRNSAYHYTLKHLFVNHVVLSFRTGTYGEFWKFKEYAEVQYSPAQKKYALKHYLVSCAGRPFLERETMLQFYFSDDLR